MMSDLEDKLKKLAEERKAENPFEKIDELEKELNLEDDGEDTMSDSEKPVDDQSLLNEEIIAKRAFADGKIFDN